MKLFQLVFFTVFLFSSTLLFSQDKVKIALDGEDKIEFVRNSIGDLRLHWLSNGSASDNLFLGQNTGFNIANSSGF